MVLSRRTATRNGLQKLAENGLLDCLGTSTQTLTVAMIEFIGKIVEIVGEHTDRQHSVTEKSVKLAEYCTAHASSDVTCYMLLSVRKRQLLCYVLPGTVRMIKTVTGEQIKDSKELILRLKLRDT